MSFGLRSGLMGGDHRGAPSASHALSPFSLVGGYSSLSAPLEYLFWYVCIYVCMYIIWIRKLGRGCIQCTPLGCGVWMCRQCTIRRECLVRGADNTRTLDVACECVVSVALVFIGFSHIMMMFSMICIIDFHLNSNWDLKETALRRPRADSNWFWIKFCFKFKGNWCEAAQSKF